MYEYTCDDGVIYIRLITILMCLKIILLAALRCLFVTGFSGENYCSFQVQRRSLRHTIIIAPRASLSSSLVHGQLETSIRQYLRAHKAYECVYRAPLSTIQSRSGNSIHLFLAVPLLRVGGGERFLNQSRFQRPIRVVCFI
jgi:hypothetical protein